MGPRLRGDDVLAAPSAQQKTKHLGGALLLRILSIISRAAVIIGTIVAIVETLHRW